MTKQSGAELESLTRQYASGYSLQAHGRVRTLVLDGYTPGTDTIKPVFPKIAQVAMDTILNDADRHLALKYKRDKRLLENLKGMAPEAENLLGEIRGGIEAALQGTKYENMPYPSLLCALFDERAALTQKYHDSFDAAIVAGFTAYAMNAYNREHSLGLKDIDPIELAVNILLIFQGLMCETMPNVDGDELISVLSGPQTELLKNYHTRSLEMLTDKGIRNSHYLVAAVGCHKTPIDPVSSVAWAAHAYNGATSPRMHRGRAMKGEEILQRLAEERFESLRSRVIPGEAEGEPDAVTKRRAIEEDIATIKALMAEGFDYDARIARIRPWVAPLQILRRLDQEIPKPDSD